MIRFGIIGAGGIAHKFARDIKLSHNAKLVAIASRSIEKAKAFKNSYNLDFAFGSYQEMAISNKIDAVYIATPHNFHHQQAILFMNNKKHVLCEKPVSVNSKELIEMTAVAKENNVLFMEAMWTRFLPSSLKVKEVVDSKILGELKSAYLEIGYVLLVDNPVDSRLLNMNLAGGSILDLGVYPISFLLSIINQEIKTIDASAEFHETGADINCVIDIEFMNNAKVKMVSSFITNMNKPAVFEFEKGNIVMEDFSRCNEFYINDKHNSLPYLGEGFTHQINSFAETIDLGLIENPIMTHNESLRVMELMDKVREIIGLNYPFE